MKKGILYRTRGYLCGAMEAFDGTKWREAVEKELNPRGIFTFNPYSKPWLNSTPEDEKSRKKLKQWMKNGNLEKVAKRFKRIRAEDLRCVDLADFLIININPKIPTWGTMEEFSLAVREKKPVFVVIDGNMSECPLWILGMIPVKYLYKTLNDALKMIKDIDSGKVKIDSERWRLLKPEYR